MVTIIIQRSAAGRRARTRLRRGGFSMLELVVSATLVVTLIAVVVPTAARANRLWQESRCYHLAVDELNNQLEVLTLLSDQERQDRLANWKPNSQLLATLPDAQLSGETLDDADGKRLRLSLNWKKSVDGPPLTMVGWIHPLKADSQ